MKKRMISLLLALMLLTVSAGAEFPVTLRPGILISPRPAAVREDIVILHTNDVHCGYEAYDKVAALAKEADVLVDAGDAVQGDVIGTLSEGGYIIDIMNELGYDVAVPGNHEFDYGMERFLSLTEEAEFPYISANFLNAEGDTVFAPYQLLEAEGVTLAFVGLCTPKTFTKSTPTYFQDGSGRFIYDFCQGENGQELYDAAQSAIDSARAAGADYVIGIGHLGIDPGSSPWTATEVIANTHGFDAFLDGHSHSVFSETVQDAAGEDVVFAQTGTKLAHIGKLTISPDGTVTHENIAVDTVSADEETTGFLAGITARFEELQNQVVARTEVELTVNGPDGKRAVRNAETNLGDLCADAYRIMLGADVGFVNGGGIRESIPAGDITYGDIIKVHPFGNEMCLAEVTGQQLLDCLELGARDLPGESGGFQHVSGMTYTVDTTIPSGVVLDEIGMFVKVDGPYRVKDVFIGGQPLDVNRTYKLASHNYLLKEQGSGNSMFGTENINLLQDCVMIDNQILIRYITEELYGVVGQQYAKPLGRIKVLTADVPAAAPVEPPAPEAPSAGEETYTVVAGDCLWNIARRFYDSGAQYTKIAAANGIADPDYIRIGQVLTIPAA